MKPRWLSLILAILGGGAVTLLALMLVAYQYGNEPSIPDMGLAAGLGAAIAGALILI